MELLELWNMEECCWHWLCQGLFSAECLWIQVVSVHLQSKSFSVSEQSLLHQNVTWLTWNGLKVSYSLSHLIHISSWGRACCKQLQKGLPIKENLKDDWTFCRSHPKWANPISSLPVEWVGKNTMPPISASCDTQCTSPPRLEPWCSC